MIRRLTASFLILSVLLLSYFFYVNKTRIKATEDKVDSLQSDYYEMYDMSEYTLDDVPDYILSAITSNGNNAEYISDENAGDIYSLTVVNSDESKSRFTYNLPIKYIENGEIRFKKPNITESKYKKFAYENTQNNIKSYFPSDIREGVEVSYNNYKVIMKPKSGMSKYITNDFVYIKDTCTLEYLDVFPGKVDIQYITTPSGLKENIILHKYSGQNIFYFNVSFENLKPAVMEGEAIPLLDSETGEIALVLGQIDARDAYEVDAQQQHTSIKGSLKLIHLGQNDYSLSVEIDRGFLEDKSTVYPVTIDPSIIIYNDNIIDTSVYSEKPDQPYFYASSYLVVGDHGDSYGDSISFVKVNTVQYNKDIDPNQITSVYFHVRESSGKTNSSVIEVHDTFYTWDQNTLTYRNKPSTYNFNDSYSKTISSSGWYDFEITGLFKAWLKNELVQGGWSHEYGFALRARDASYSSKHFSSANHPTEAPCFIINYVDDSISSGVYYLQAEHSGMNMDVNQDTKYVIQYPFHGCANQQFRIQYHRDGYYKIRSEAFEPKYISGNPGYLNVESLSTNRINISLNNTSGDWLLFKIIPNNDGTYRLMNKWGGNKSKAITVHSAYLNQEEYVGASNQKFRLIKSNDYIFSKVNELHSLAKQYESNSTKANKLVLQYMRRERYEGFKWIVTAGGIDQNFVTYVDSRNPTLAFLTNQLYVYDIANKVDFNHLIATMNAILHDTMPLNVAEHVIDDLAGWAGDLQQMTNQVLKQTNFSNDISTIMDKTLSLLKGNESNSSFSKPDLNADLDATYLAPRMNSTELLGNQLSSYYRTTFSKRLENFLGDNINIRQMILEDSVFYLSSMFSSVYISLPPPYGGRYYPLILDYDVSSIQASCIARAFTDYLFDEFSIYD